MKNIPYLLPFVMSAVLSFLVPVCAESDVKIESIQFRGHHQVSEKDLRGILPFKKGSAYVVLQSTIGWQMIHSFYNARGFLEATVSVKTTVNKNRASFIFSVEEGTLYRFGETHVEGLKKVPVQTIQNALTYRSGDPYVRAKLFASQNAVYSTALFDDLSISVATTSAKTTNVSIRVKERQLKWIKGGIGWGSEERERLSLIFRHENFLRRSYTAQVMGTWSHIWEEYQAEFLNRYLFNSKTEERLLSSWRNEHRDGYEWERLRVENTLSRELFSFTRGSLGVRVDRNVVYDVDPLIALTTPDFSDTRSVNFGLSRNTTDDVFFPRRGKRTDLFFQHAGGLFKGINHFNKGSIDTRAYQRVFGPVIGAVAVRAGVVEEFGVSSDVPIFERFFMGGANSVRGYRERGVGPKDLQGSPLGGKYKLSSSLEVRFPLFWKFSGAVFVDGGQVGSHFNDVDPGEWRVGAGSGIRLVTPVGPLRLDAGYKLNPEPQDEDLWRLHLSLGEAF